MNMWKLFRIICNVLCVGAVIGGIAYVYFYMSDGVVDGGDRNILITAVVLAVISVFGLSIDMSTDGGKNTSKKAIMAGVSFAMFMLVWRVLASLF
jgi:hypothetical protein